MIWLSKIYKASSIDIDTDNTVYIEAPYFEPALKLPKKPEKTEPEIDPEESAKNLLANAKKEADEIIDNAKKQAESILHKANLEADELKTIEQMKAQSEGDKLKAVAEKRGYSDGYNEGKNDSESLIQKAKDFQKQTEDERQKAIENFEPEMIQLITKVSEKMLGSAMKISPQIILNLIRQALNQSALSGDIILRVSKDDFDFVESQKESIMEYVSNGANLEILRDFSLKAGDCIIETPFGIIDSSYDMQLSEIIKAFTLIK